MDEELELVASSELQMYFILFKYNKLKGPAYLNLLNELGQTLGGVATEVGELVAFLLIDLPDRG